MALNAPKLEKTSAILNSVDVVFFIETPPNKSANFPKINIAFLSLIIGTDVG